VRRSLGTRTGLWALERRSDDEAAEYAVVETEFARYRVELNPDDETDFSLAQDAITRILRRHVAPDRETWRREVAAAKEDNDAMG